MSERYEIDTADAWLEIVPPGTELGEDELDSYALIVGDLRASAYVILGSLESLGEFACRITALVARAVDLRPATNEDREASH